MLLFPDLNMYICIALSSEKREREEEREREKGRERERERKKERERRADRERARKGGAPDSTARKKRG